MHELSIMQSALSAALAEAEKAHATRVHVLRLRVGALSGVVPEALEFAFETLSQGTPAQGARLAIEPVPARFRCVPCDHEFVVEDMLVVCPACGGSNAELRAGRELEIASLEVD
jgi:hydrogenase nickel incorporation protein HypA/HybF